MKQYLIDTVNKWQAGKTQEEINRIGKIGQERLNECKRELNRLVRTEDSISIKVRIALSKAYDFNEIRQLLTN